MFQPERWGRKSGGRGRKDRADNMFYCGTSGSLLLPILLELEFGSLGFSVLSEMETSHGDGRREPIFVPGAQVPKFEANGSGSFGVDDLKQHL